MKKAPSSKAPVAWPQPLGKVMAALQPQATAHQGPEKVSALGEAWTSMTLRLVQANMEFAQTMMRSWWSPPSGAWLPLGPASFGDTGTLPSTELRAAPRPTEPAHPAPLGMAPKGPVRRRVVAKATGKARGR